MTSCRDPPRWWTITRAGEMLETKTRFVLIKRQVLEKIRAGEIDLQFRRWKRPTVKVGGTLKTRIGVLAIDAIERVRREEVTDDQARRAGFRDAADFSSWLDTTREGELHRIELRYAGDDPRVALRENAELGADELQAIAAQLDRIDARSSIGAWTARAMELIARHPGRLAEKLAAQMGLEKHPFKARIRKLKALGLTQSLEIGYRLSPRGERVHAFRSKRERGK
jgi:hypothetical protein